MADISSVLHIFYVFV